MKKPIISIVVAMSSQDRAIGKDEKLLWHIPDDMMRFKALTMGHPVIMGRKTFESIVDVLGGPLPGRTNIVVTRDKQYQVSGCIVVHSLADALAEARKLDKEEIHIGGGSELYKQALPYVDKLYLTLVDDKKEADTFFPDYSEFTKKEFVEEKEYNGLKYTWVNLTRE